MKFFILVLLPVASAWAQETRPIGAGESQNYTVTLRSGEYLYARATQQGIDLALQLLDSAGKTLTSMNRGVAEGPEELFWLSAADGKYTLTVKAASGVQARGTYELTYQTRAPTPIDLSCHRASAALAQAEPLAQTGLGDNRRKAVGLFEASLKDFSTCGSQGWVASVQEKLGDTLMYLGERARPAQLYHAAADIHRSLGEERALAVNLSDYGAAAADLGRLQESVAALEDSLRLKRKFGNKAAEAITANIIAEVYRDLGQPQKALDNLRLALTLAREGGAKTTEANVLSRLGNFLARLGRYQEALEASGQAYRIATETGKPDIEASAQASLANVYSAMGNLPRARQYWESAAASYRKAGNRTAVSTILQNAGLADVISGHPEAGLPALERSLAHRQELGARLAVADARTAICGVLVELNRLAPAAEHGRLALDVATELGAKSVSGSAHYCLGLVAHRSGDLPVAREHLQKALDLHREVANRRADVASDLAELAAIERDAGRSREALVAIEESTRMADADRASVNNPLLRATYLSTRANRLTLHIELLLKMHEVDPGGGFALRAFELSERWRARALVESLDGPALTKRLDPEELKEESKLLDRITAVQKELFRAGLPPARRRELNAALSKAERELDLFQARVSGDSASAGTNGEGIAVEALQKQLTGSNAALVEFVLGSPQSYAFVISEKSFSTHTLPSRKVIEGHLESFRQTLAQGVNALTAPAAGRKTEEAGTALYRDLFTTLEPGLARKTSLTVVADGMLHYLPFEALPTPSGLVLERFNVSYAPSAAALVSLRRRGAQRASAPRRILALGDPRYAGARPAAPDGSAERGFDFRELPQTRAEVTGIGTTFPAGASRLLLGAEASEAKFKAEDLSTYRYLHFATHGYFDESEPRRSGIVLSTTALQKSEDGILQAGEIATLKLKMDLVTLSACETGLGAVLTGEGVVGLTRAFLTAGAQSVVASLWNVNDTATAELMKHFYRNLNRALPIDQALRQAKLSLMRTPGTAWRHPYFWASFVAVGDSSRVLGLTAGNR